jgi:predicted HicB family RNase H-like nuclease
MAEQHTSRQHRAKRVLSETRGYYGAARDWIALHNFVFGIAGSATSRFTTPADRTWFARTNEYAKIQEMLARKREEAGDPEPVRDLVGTANGKISVRVPRTIHAALLAEAEAEGVSLNQLIAGKLTAQLRAVVDPRGQ